MTKQENNIIIEEYKKTVLYNQLALNNGHRSDSEKASLITMECLLKALKIDYKPYKNEVILENNKYLLNTWSDICQYVNNYFICCNDNIDFITDEIKFTSSTEKQYAARLEVIQQFKTSLKNKNIILQ